MRRIKIEAIAKLTKVTPAGTWRDEYKNRIGILLMREFSGHLGVYFYPYCPGSKQDYLSPSSGVVSVDYPKITVRSKNSTYDFEIDNSELTDEQKLEFLIIRNEFFIGLL